MKYQGFLIGFVVLVILQTCASTLTCDAGSSKQSQSSNSAAYVSDIVLSESFNTSRRGIFDVCLWPFEKVNGLCLPPCLFGQVRCVGVFCCIDWIDGLRWLNTLIHEVNEIILGALDLFEFNTRLFINLVLGNAIQLYNNILGRIGLLFGGVDIQYDIIITNIKVLTTTQDVDFKVVLSIMNGIKPFTWNGFLETIKALIVKNEEIILPHVISFAQKVLGFSYMPSNYFRTNFIYIVNHLTLHETDGRLTSWEIQIQGQLPAPVPQPPARPNPLVTYVKQLQVLKNIFQMFESVQQGLINGIYKIFTIQIQFDYRQISINLEELIRNYFTLNKVISEFISKIPQNPTGDETIRFISDHLKKSDEIGLAFVHIFGTVFGISNTQLNEKINEVSELLVHLFDVILNPVEQTTPTTSTTTTTTTTTPAPLPSPEEIAQTRMKVLIIFLENTLQTNLKPDDILAMRLRDILNPNGDLDVKKLLHGLYDKNREGFKDLLEFIGRTVNVENPDYDLMWETFQKQWTTNVDFQQWIYALAKNTQNKQITNIIKFLQMFIENLFDATYKPYDNFFVKMHETLLETNVDMKTIGENLNDLFKNDNSNLNEIIITLTIRENNQYFDYKDFEEKIKTLLLLKEPLSKSIIEIIKNVTNLPETANLEDIVKKVKREGDRSLEEVQLLQSLVNQIKMIFCDYSNSDNAVLTNLYYLILSKSSISINDAITEIYNLFISYEPDLTTVLNLLPNENLTQVIHEGATNDNSNVFVIVKILTRVFKVNIVSIDWIIAQIKLAISTNSLNIEEKRKTDAKEEAIKLVGEIFSPNSPIYGLSNNVLAVANVLLRTSITQQLILEQVKILIERDDLDYLNFAKWIEQMNQSNSQAGLTYALKTIKDMYDNIKINQNEAQLRAIASFLRKAFNLTESFSIDDFYSKFEEFARSIRYELEDTSLGTRIHLWIRFEVVDTPVGSQKRKLQ
ncbi:uncharacterized protein LOC123297276 [Chrysoperla carnea]|uniref:uncharacterized protein LOC123297276 n=1 Tax=Chrysoperla carnea TaxID=189513 RepID=UPI001D064CDF|nr:uncharacterized protein LOC123297276 [Chrysoperla carnea]